MNGQPPPPTDASTRGAAPTRSDLSRLPQVDALLRHPDAAAAVADFGRGPFVAALRRTLDDVRRQVAAGVKVPADPAIVAGAAAVLARRRAGRLRRVINATGVVLHTNLGRAPLSEAARAAVSEAAGYTPLEYDLHEGERGSRTGHVGELAAELVGTEAATVVNNGAAALVLVLAALSTGREAIVSRGELIEIGGSYRLPDVMAVSGALMREVGTTNRTRAADYRDAIGDETGLLLKVHRSNYQVVGFAETTPARELSALARGVEVPFVYDVGSGLVADQGGPLGDEPSLTGAIRDGADLVICSGDKLLGGPQAGIVAGHRALVSRCTRHPLARAFRIDKLQRAALEATLEAHLRSPDPVDVPTWAMLHADIEQLRRRAQRVADAIGEGAAVEASSAPVGGGSLPGVELDTFVVVLTDPRPEALAASLRALDVPVIARVVAGRVLLDLRTVPPADDDELVGLVRAALAGVDGRPV